MSGSAPGYTHIVSLRVLINQYVHMWVFENAGDREKKRNAMWSDPEWVSYTEKSAELGALAHQENKLMRPVEFFSLKR